MKTGGLELVFKPIGAAETSLGELAVYSISVGDQATVLGGDVKALEPDALAKRFIRYVAYPVDALGDDQSKPSDPALTEEQVSSLDGKDIDAIIDLFISSQEYLFKESKYEEYVLEDGSTDRKHIYGDIVHPKMDGESSTQYLHRLFVLQEEKGRKQFAAMTRGVAGFSGSLQDKIQSTLKMGRTLSRFADKVRISEMHGLGSWVPKELASPDVADPTRSTADYAALAGNAEEARWAPFEAVNERLDALVELGAESSEFMVQMNHTQTQVASEIQASGEEASKIGRESLTVAKWGLWLTHVVLVVTLLAFVVSFFDRSSSSDNAAFFRNQSIRFLTGQQRIADEIALERNAARAGLRAVVSQFEQDRIAQSQSLEAALQKQVGLLKKYVEDQARSQRLVESLLLRVSELEARIELYEASDYPVESSGGETAQESP